MALTLHFIQPTNIYQNHRVSDDGSVIVNKTDLVPLHGAYNPVDRQTSNKRTHTYISINDDTHSDGNTKIRGERRIKGERRLRLDWVGKGPEG